MQIEFLAGFSRGKNSKLLNAWQEKLGIVGASVVRGGRAKAEIHYLVSTELSTVTKCIFRASR